MGGIYSFIFGKKEPGVPITGIVPRIKNIFLIHFRGLLGVIVPIAALSWQINKNDKGKTVECMWICMAWFFFIQPVNIPVTGLIVVFCLPMMGVMSSDLTCACFMNEGIALFIVGGMLLLLLNNSGVDKRVAVWFICAGDVNQFSLSKLVYKCCVAGYFLSMICSRLIVCNILMNCITPALINLQAATSRHYEPCFDKVRYILNTAIQASCSIGSIAIIHASYPILAFRAIFYETKLPGMAWPDIFNYLDYSSFALPVSLFMIIVNILYYSVLINKTAVKPMTEKSTRRLRDSLMELKKSVPKKITLHEKLTMGFTFLALVVYFLRWSQWFKGSSFKRFNEIPGIGDATVAAIFVVFLHAFPKSFGFLKFVTAKKKSQLGPLRPESAIMWWRFVDKNTNYGYILLIGAGVALSAAIRLTEYDKTLASTQLANLFTDKSWMISVLLICVASVVTSNIMSGTAACVVLLPFFLHLAPIPVAVPEVAEGLRQLGKQAEYTALQDEVEAVPPSPWSTNCHLAALACGIGTSLGFMFPFLFTPAYFCHYVGKVPKRKMVRYGLGSVVICTLILWLCIVYYAPLIWRGNVYQEPAPVTGPVEVTTAAPEAGGGEEL